jgi:hypothetical protein
LLVGQAFAYSLFHAIERKNLIRSRVELADFLKVYTATESRKTIDVFFPYSTAYRVMEVSAFLRYKGLRLVGDGHPLEPTRAALRMETPEPFADGQCVSYASLACFRVGSRPARGLIVLLPDDDVPEDAVAAASENARLVNRWPGYVGADIARILSVLHGMSPVFSGRKLPLHWPQMHVYRTE